MNAAPIDETHDPDRRAWLESANGETDFPIQNLPFGIVARPGRTASGAVAIGDQAIDLAALAQTGLLTGLAEQAARAAGNDTLNALLQLGTAPRRALRRRLSELLDAKAAFAGAVAPCLYPLSDCKLHVPCAIGDYTDFYAGIHHATNVGRQFRPDNPLLPNYKHVPIGYHGRASSVRLSGTPVRRPRGQVKPPTDPLPHFAPSTRLDYELELGLWIGPGNACGEPVPIAMAADQIAGYCLLNDWSARDIQAWEYQPLGPFLSKSFATTISGWIVTTEALAPFRIAQPARPPGDPQPLPYLFDPADQSGGALDIDLQILLETADFRNRGLPPQCLSRSNARHLYWTPAQMVAHHTSNGCDLRPGDLLGTGTISGPDPGSYGSLLEESLGGQRPLTLNSGEQRGFLHDGDEISLRARAVRRGFASIGFGICRATILPAYIP